MVTVLHVVAVAIVRWVILLWVFFLLLLLLLMLMLLVLCLLLSMLWHKRLIIIIKAIDVKFTLLDNFRILPSSYLKTAAAVVTRIVVVVVIVVDDISIVVMANTAVTCFISWQRIVPTNAVLITAATAATAAPNDLGSRGQIVGFWYRIYRTVCSSHTTASNAGVAGAQQISPVDMTAIVIGIEA